ncbi:MAG TPA: tRNA 5-methoxyuridine(34)/uridine 5-oxyacetic acid(34) synthase CmoB, partial [Alcanivorax sp.]|nr:tRNA 5-methoxyuridine(34)/uridine 5-oxyacetic acid(34) synthase CmoB [Alcanivorax sp.]
MLDTYLNELDAALPSLLGEGGAPVAALTRHRLLDKPHGDLPRW